MIQNVLIVIGLFAVLLFLPRGIRRWRSRAERWIEAAELEQRLARHEEVLVVDVRDPDEFSGPLGHIPGARNIPLDEIERRFEELESGRQRPIVLVCKTDRRSASAAQLARKRGARDVFVLRGGMVEWNREGFATRSA